MNILNEIAEHKGVAAVSIAALLAIAVKTFGYARTLASSPADRIKPFSDQQMLDVRSDIEGRKAKLGIKPRFGKDPG